MKILLANLPTGFLHCRWDIKIEKSTMKYFPYPVKIAYPTSLLKREGYDAYIIDGLAEEMSKREFTKRFKEISPDLLVVETSASSFESDLKMIKVFKKIKPALKVAALGYHATPAWRECLKSGYDYVIVGECDYSILDLVKYLNDELKSFPKGVVAKGHKFIPRPLIQNLDELPWPERNSLPMHKYNDPKLHGFNVVLISSRGCPNGCMWCTVPIYYQQRSWRPRSPKLVVDEMEYLWLKYSPDELYLDDDNFAVNEKHVVDICKELIKRKLNINWNCMVDANIKFRTMKWMKKTGCTGITIGAESADDEVLKQMEGKPITRKDIVKFVDYCRKLGIRSHVCWVLGMKGSSKKSDLDTVNFALELPSDTLQFSICMPYIGTELYRYCDLNNYLATKDWKHFIASNQGIIDYPNYSHREIEEVLNYAMREWHKKILFKRPDILLFHFYNVYKYQGIRGVFKVGIENLRRLF